MAKAEPKYLWIKQQLLGEIRRGTHAAGQAFITEREVCERFGVSRITAVRALNDLVHEGVLTRKRGVGTFVADQTEQRPRPPSLIGCVFAELSGHHVLEILAGIQQACGSVGASVRLFDSASDPARELANLDQARRAGVDGLVVYPVDGQTNASAIADPGPPVVLVDRYHPAFPTNAVLPDSFRAAVVVTEDLLARGHTRIGVAWGEVDCSSVLEHLAGHRRALLDHGVRVDPELSALLPYDRWPEAERRNLLRSWLDRSPADQPTALVGVNSEVVFLLRTDLAVLGVAPDRFAWAAFGDDNPTALRAIGAAGATLPSRQMGVAAGRFLLDRLAEEVALPITHLVLPVRLTTATTGRPEPDSAIDISKGARRA
ncbi:LacI family DNA-binding transcriptional regulator [Actinopolymorpha alba]|uniref:LacI family DNA-binding transcriptional regulator n=1 Tax=Actinopolymorpha alba TaxID=533267 RepID=UPI000382C062|nr:GntR family transcriptional regulator [Actinopolymorpha alba]